MAPANKTLNGLPQLPDCNQSPSAAFEAVVLIVDPLLTQRELDALLPFVSLEKQERIKRFHFVRDTQNALLGDILARVEICRATGLSNKQLAFSTNEYGKPYLTTTLDIHYNISHAGHYIACAIDEQPVGIDIEMMKAVDLKLAERFFSPDEAEYILAATGVLTTRRFFEVWTKKESRIKWEGKGLSKPLPSFSVFDFEEQRAIYYHQVFHDDKAICHLCSAKREEPSVRVMDTAALLGCINL